MITCGIAQAYRAGALFVRSVHILLKLCERSFYVILIWIVSC